MYCFSQICRICLKLFSTEFANLQKFDSDSIKYYEKLKFCVPEIITDDNKLPENLCHDCQLHLQQAYEFKKICINNTKILYDYVAKLSAGYKSKHHYQLDLLVAMNEVDTEDIPNKVSNCSKEIKNEIKLEELIENQNIPDEKIDDHNKPDEIIENQNIPDETIENHKPDEIIEERNKPDEIIEDKNKLDETIENQKLDEIIENQNKTDEIIAEQNKPDEIIKNENKPEKIIKDESKPDEIIEYKIKQEISDVDREILGETSVYTISLNQWDLFETKYTCRCVKEYNSFTEKTSHLCQNCEGELHGFRLSKLKVGNAENRYKTSLIGQTESDDNSSIVSADVTNERNEKNLEKGFDYNDFLLSRAHVNEVKRQIQILDSDKENESKEEITVKKSSKPFECPICKKCFSRKYNMFIHYGKHEDSAFYFCDRCRARFVDYNEYNTHLIFHENQESIRKERKNSENLDSSLDEDILNQSLNSSSESLTCSTCDKVFERKKHLISHIMSHMGNKEFRCGQCGEEFFRKEILDAHLDTHKGDSKRYQCDKCSKGYNHASNLRRHKQFAHGGKYACSVCNAKFEKKENLVEHILDNHTKSAKTKSPIKEVENHTKSAKTKSPIKEGNSSSEETGTPTDKPKNINSPKVKYSCKKCSKVFLRLNNLRSHELSHTAEPKLKEKRVYSNLSGMKVEINGKKGVMCPICKKIFSVKTSIRKHIDTHKKKKKPKLPKLSDIIEKRPYIPLQALTILNDGKPARKCPICKLIFSIKTNIRAHIRTHSREKKNVCKICKEKFSSIFLMKLHLRSHNLKYKCDLCSKLYFTKTSLDRHVIKHSMN